MFEIKDQQSYDKWKNVSESSLHQDIFNFVERWIALLNSRPNEDLEDIVYDCRNEAGYSDITDFMFGCALGTIRICYTNGDRICSIFKK